MEPTAIITTFCNKFYSIKMRSFQEQMFTIQALLQISPQQLYGSKWLEAVLGQQFLLFRNWKTLKCAINF